MNEKKFKELNEEEMNQVAGGGTTTNMLEQDLNSGGFKELA